MSEISFDSGSYGLDKKIYIFKQLKQKYNNFLAPECEITIGSKTLKDSECDIEELIVDQAADGTAGGCRIKIVDFYNYETSSWHPVITHYLQVGAKLEIKLGYEKKKIVFFGYVDDFTIEYGDTTEPCIRISGLDGLGYLMSVRSRVFAGEKQLSEIVKLMLNDSVSVGAAKSVSVAPTILDATVQRIKDGEDSYTFLNTLAKQTGMQLMCICGEMIFDNIQKMNCFPMITLHMDEDGLYSFSKRLSLANQPTKVIVHGRDKNNEAIRGEAYMTSFSGQGKRANDVAHALLKYSVYEEDSPLVMTWEECNNLAQVRFDDLAQNYVFGSGECVGIPEIQAGRCVQIKGLDRMTDGTYFMTKVEHILNDDGYITKFEVRGAFSNEFI